MCFGVQGANTDSERDTVRVIGCNGGFTFDGRSVDGDAIEDDFSELSSSRDLARRV